MTDAKHTPGPWTYGGHLFDSRIMAEEAPSSWSSRTIAVVDHTEDEMGEANAHLIAAAPDLLAACTHALNALERVAHTVDREELDAVVEVAALTRAAIAKARGESK